VTEWREIGPNEDPVCGMTVDPVASKAKGLADTYYDREFVFCGKGCLLEFRDDPEAHLAPGYQPSM
jgi:YHS domain-containing protein